MLFVLNSCFTQTKKWQATKRHKNDEEAWLQIRCQKLASDCAMLAAQE